MKDPRSTRNQIRIFGEISRGLLVKDNMCQCSSGRSRKADGWDVPPSFEPNKGGPARLDMIKDSFINSVTCEKGESEKVSSVTGKKNGTVKPLEMSSAPERLYCGQGEF